MSPPLQLSPYQTVKQVVLIKPSSRFTASFNKSFSQSDKKPFIEEKMDGETAMRGRKN